MVVKHGSVKVLHSVCQQIWKTHQWPRTGKDQFSFQSQRRAMSKNVQTTAQLHSFHMLAHVKWVQCTKSFKLEFSSMWTENFQMYKLDLEKAEEPEIKLPKSIGSQKKGIPEKHLLLLHWLHPRRPLTVWITTKCGNFFKRWEYQTPLPNSSETCMQVKKQLN